MENPFVYGDEYFSDREDELKELKLDLSSGLLNIHKNKSTSNL